VAMVFNYRGIRIPFFADDNFCRLHISVAMVLHPRSHNPPDHQNPSPVRLSRMASQRAISSSLSPVMVPEPEPSIIRPQATSLSSGVQ